MNYGWLHSFFGEKQARNKGAYTGGGEDMKKEVLKRLLCKPLVSKQITLGGKTL
jgi:hypothetical protein